MTRAQSIGVRLVTMLATAGWGLVIVAWLVVWGLGTWGFIKHSQSSFGFSEEMLEALYNALQLFFVNMDTNGGPNWPCQVQAARFLAPLLTAAATVKALLVLVQERLERWGLRDHAVICGGTQRRGRHIAQSFERQGVRTAVIDTNPTDVEPFGGLQDARVMIAGQIDDPNTLKIARVDRARFVIAATEDDALNAQVGAQCRALVLERQPGALTCAVHVSDPLLWRLLREEEFAVRSKAAPIRLEFFNAFETGARMLLDATPPFLQTQRKDAVRPCLLIVGLGRLGQSVLIRAAKDSRLRNLSPTYKPLVAVVDRQASSRLDWLTTRYPLLAGTFDMKAIDMDAECTEFDQGDFLDGLRDDAALTAAYICLGREQLSMSAAIALLRSAKRRGERFPIVARVAHEIGLPSLLRLGVVRTFPLLDKVFTADLLRDGVTETIARALHADYVKNERAKGITRDTNPSVVEWGDDLSERAKEQNRNQADSIREILNIAGYRIMPLVDWDAWRFEFPDSALDQLARAEHDRWIRQMKVDDYRRGPMRDDTRRTHPHMEDWGELSEEAREKDRAFVRLWPEHLFVAGFQIQPVKTIDGLLSDAGRSTHP